MNAAHPTLVARACRPVGHLRLQLLTLGFAVALSTANAAPDGAAFEVFETSVRSSLVERLADPIHAAEAIAQGLSFLTLLILIVVRLGANASDPVRSIAAPLLVAAAASAFPPIVRGLGEGATEVIRQTGGLGAESAQALTKIASLWLPPESALVSGAAARTVSQAHGWVADLYNEVEQGQGLSEEARSSLWRIAAESPHGDLIGTVALSVGSLLSAAAVAETMASAMHAAGLNVLLALCAFAWAGLLLPVTSGLCRALLLQTVLATLWPLGWSIAHVCAVTLAEASCAMVHAQALSAPSGALADAGAIQLSADWLPAALGVALASLFLMAAILGVPILGVILASAADSAFGGSASVSTTSGHASLARRET